MKKKLVEVVWVDIEATAGWQDDDARGLRPVKSYGLLISKTKDIIKIGSTYDPELKKWAEVNKFPRGCILSIRIIETVEV